MTTTAPLMARRPLAAVDLVRRLAVGQDLLLQVGLDRLLEAGVDVEHHGVADLRCGGAEGADHVAGGVDRESLAASRALQVRLVLGLDPRDSDLAALAVALVGVRRR